MSAIPTQTPADMAVQTLKVDSCVNAPRVTTEQDTDIVSRPLVWDGPGLESERRRKSVLLNSVITAEELKN